MHSIIVHNILKNYSTIYKFELFFCYYISETKHQLHAKQVVQSLDFSKYDGIVCVSGDGILVEVSSLKLLLLIGYSSYQVLPL